VFCQSFFLCFCPLSHKNSPNNLELEYPLRLDSLIKLLGTYLYPPAI
jgi:hypothetical protein